MTPEEIEKRVVEPELTRDVRPEHVRQHKVDIVDGTSFHDENQPQPPAESEPPPPATDESKS
jgi:hypothetical protein